MAVTESSTKISIETDGIQKEFTFNIPYQNDTDIKAILLNSDNQEVIYNEGTDYAVQSDTPEAGGTLVFTEPPPTGVLTIKREVEISQGSTFRPISGFPEEVITKSFDKGIMIAQQQQEQIDRCLKLRQTSNKTDFFLGDPKPGMVLVVSEDGNSLESSTVSFNDISGAALNAEKYSQQALQYKNEAEAAKNSILNDSGVQAISSDLTGPNYIGAIGSDISGDNTIGTVANNLDDIQAVGSNIDAIAFVNTHINELEAIGSDLAGDNTIGTVANNINAVQSVGSNMEAISFINGHIDELGVIGDDLAGANTIGTVANNINAVQSVGSNMDAISFINNHVDELEIIGADLANGNTIGIVASNINEVTETGANIGAIKNLNANIADVINVSDDLSGANTIGAVSSNLSDISNVSGNLSDIHNCVININEINTVADNLTSGNDISTVANNISEIKQAVTSASEAKESADNALIWAEGTDEQVAALGGEHSAKGWANEAHKDQLQADWAETDPTKVTFIKNKPDTEFNGLNPFCVNSGSLDSDRNPYFLKIQKTYTSSFTNYECLISEDYIASDFGVPMDESGYSYIDTEVSTSGLIGTDIKSDFYLLITTGTLSSEVQPLLTTQSIDNYAGIRLIINANGELVLLMGSTSDSLWNQLAVSAPLSEDTSYKIHVQLDGSTAKIGVARDNEEYTYTSGTVSNWSSSLRTTIRLGMEYVDALSGRINYFKGSIDLKEFYILKNDEEFYRAATAQISGNIVTNGTFKCTTAAGKTYTVDSEISASTGLLEVGEYNIYVNPVTSELLFKQNNIEVGKKFSASAKEGDYLLCTATLPYALEIFGELSPGDRANDIPCGTLTKEAEGVSLELLDYNKDWIVPDNSNKLNVDCSNLSEAGKKVFDGQWVLTELHAICVNTSVSVPGAAFNISDYLPDDGNDYEILCLFSAKTSAESAMGIFQDSSKTKLIGWAAAAPAYFMGVSIIVPILNGSRSIYLSGASGSVNCSFLGYRRLGTNN